MIHYEDVAAEVDVADGALLGIELRDGTPVCLYNVAGAIGAVGNICTHAEFLMSDGFLLADGTIECAWHGARFNCRSGAVTRQPATEPLPVYKACVERGRVLVAKE